MFLMRDERRKEERSKQGQQTTRQSNTAHPRQPLFHVYTLSLYIPPSLKLAASSQGAADYGAVFAGERGSVWAGLPGCADGLRGASENTFTFNPFKGRGD